VNLLSRIVGVIVLAAAIGGCSNKSHTPPPPSSTPSATPQRGDLIDNPPKKAASYAPSDLLQLLSGSDLGKTFLQLAYTPKCTITVYHLTYETVDPQGNITPASGAFMVPGSSSDTDCNGSRPILLYAHGTTTDRNFNLAQLDAAFVNKSVIRWLQTPYYVRSWSPWTNG